MLQREGSRWVIFDIVLILRCALAMWNAKERRNSCTIASTSLGVFQPSLVALLCSKSSSSGCKCSQCTLQVLALLQKIKRQDAGEEAMPPVTLPSLPEGEPAGASGRGKGKKGKLNSKKASQPDIDAAADGFMDLEDDDWFEDDFLDDEDEDEDEEEDEDFDDTDAVVEAYLARSGASTSAFDEFEEPILVGGGEGKGGGRRNQRRRKYKGRG